jgi:hypothetical protein
MGPKEHAVHTFIIACVADLSRHVLCLASLISKLI